ncbi:hypothetical protein SDC9_199778 [bioreactor metagenome]|uniref:Uncharacterized protein n=1 Tax=bioreactor metagenome TaxID=1076179 RepID=A0A645IUQ4_9ZZZZ
MGHHQEADGVHLQLARQRDVLLGDVGLGAVGGDTDGVHPEIARHLQVIDGADARQQQRRDLGLLHLGNHRAEIFLVGVRREAVIDRRAAEAVAVGDFDQRNAGGVETGGDADHLVEAHQVTLGMHAVAQRHVVQGDVLFGHGGVLLQAACRERRPASISSANISAVRAPAAVMMSRLPAYLGR